MKTILIMGCFVYLMMGINVATIAMDHVRRFAAEDNQFMAMAVARQRWTFAMMFALVSVVLTWPIAVLGAILMTIRTQRRAAGYSLN